MEADYINTAEAAALLGVSDRTIRTLCSERKIKHERLNGRNLRFKKEWIAAYLESITIEVQKQN